ncbi:MAG: hypothetical protein ABSG32_18880 [Terriglobia bacterium]|jgi:hypothetical protein
MAFTPDVIVTTDYSPGTFALVAEAKGATANLDEAAIQLKEYMLRTGCPVGIIFTPQVLRIYKYRFLGRTEDPIELVGDFPSGELLETRGPMAGSESAVESNLLGWLDELAQTGQAAVSDPRLNSAINEHILPAVSGGRVSIAHPIMRES